MAQDLIDQAYVTFERNLTAGALDAAEKVAKELVEKHFVDERSYVALARVHAARGKLGEAIATLKKLDPVNNRLPHALAWLAAFFYTSGEEKLAMEHARLSAECDEEVPSALELLVEMSEKTGNHLEAAASLGKLVKLRPDNVELWKRLADTLRRGKRFQAAVQAMEHVVTLRPKDVDAWVMLIKVRLDAGEVEGALHDVQSALTQHPRHPELLKVANVIREAGTATSNPLAKEINSVRELLDAGERTNALKKLETLMRMHRTTRQLRFVRAEVDAAAPNSNVSELIISAMNLMKQYPEAWEPRSLLAELLVRDSTMNNVKQAMTHAEEAWSMSGGHPRSGLTLIRTYRAGNKLPIAKALGAQLRIRSPQLAAKVDRILAGA